MNVDSSVGFFSIIHFNFQEENFFIPPIRNFPLSKIVTQEIALTFFRSSMFIFISTFSRFPRPIRKLEMWDSLKKIFTQLYLRVSNLAIRSLIIFFLTAYCNTHTLCLSISFLCDSYVHCSVLNEKKKIIGIINITTKKFNNK